MTSKFVWFDLTAADAAAASVFYTELFGWASTEPDNVGDYRTWFLDGEMPWAGVIAGADSGRWVPYVQVDDLDAAVDKARSLGATVLQGKTEGPGGTAVTIADPSGAPVALFIPR